MGNVINSRESEYDRVELVFTGSPSASYAIVNYYRNQEGEWEELASASFDNEKEAQEEFMWATKDLT